MAEYTGKYQQPIRRKKQIPKWKRMLHKYWPPIRFGLIILGLIMVITLVGCSIGSVVRGCSNQKPVASTPDNTTAAAEEAPMTQEEIDSAAAAIIKEADFIAAGYNYQKAIDLLKEFSYYDQYPEMAEKISAYEVADQQLVVYENMGEITHVFFHSLIVDPTRSFDGEYTDGGYNQYMTTVAEFNAILQEMYNKGYVLVTPYQVARENASGQFEYCEIRLPAGKKPFIMSQDDLNYYGYMIAAQDGSNETPIFATTAGDGFAHKIVIGEDGFPTCEYMDKNGVITTGDYDLVPALETFIQQHPDFSYQGARAVLGMTGYEGVFGYRTKPSYRAAMGDDAYNKEVAAAKAVAQNLRDHGWVLASHSYGHPAYGEITAEKVNTDSQKWEDTVQTIIGDADVILYPHGSDIAGVEKYSFDNAKFTYLYEDGYRYFFNVDSSIYWTQLGDNYYRGGRRNLDGYRMYYNPNLLEDLFDVKNVFDQARPTPVPAI